MQDRHELGSILPKASHIFVKTLEVHIFIQRAKMNISAEYRDGDIFTGTFTQKRALSDQWLARPHEADVFVFGTQSRLLQMGYSHGSLSQI